VPTFDKFCFAYLYQLKHWNAAAFSFRFGLVWKAIALWILLKIFVLKTLKPERWWEKFWWNVSPAIESCRFAASFWGISWLGSSFCNDLSLHIFVLAGIEFHGGQTDRRFYLTSEKIRHQGEKNDRKVFESSSEGKYYQEFGSLTLTPCLNF